MNIISGRNTLMLYYPSSTQGGCSKRLIQVQPSLLRCLKFQILIILTHYFITHPKLIVLYFFCYSFKYFFFIIFYSFFILHSLSLFLSVSLSLFFEEIKPTNHEQQEVNYNTKYHEQQQANHAQIQSSPTTTQNIYNDQDQWDAWRS